MRVGGDGDLWPRCKGIVEKGKERGTSPLWVQSKSHFQDFLLARESIIFISRTTEDHLLINGLLILIIIIIIIY